MGAPSRGKCLDAANSDIANRLELCTKMQLRGSKIKAVKLSVTYN